MPKGTVRRVRRMIARLLVLVVLLFSGAQASTAILLDAHHHDVDVAGLTIAAIGPNVTTAVGMSTG
jgi:hypothetical protein